MTASFQKYYFYFLDSFSKISLFIKEYRFCFLSGMLAGASFIPFPVFAVFFCWAPLWFFLSQQKKIKHIIIGSWITQWCMTAIGFSWIPYTAHKFGDFNWFISFLIFILFCSFSNIFIVFASSTWFFLSQHLKKDTLTKLLLLPILFSLFHLITPSIFPWNMGYNWLWASFSGFHTAEVWGFKFLNTLFYIFNLLILILFKHRLDKIGKVALFLFFFLFASINIFGWYLKKRLSPPDRFLKAMLVQNNIGNLKNLKYKLPFQNAAQKSLYQSKGITVRSLLKLRKQRKNISFIVWPEGAYPYTLLEDEKKIENLSSLIRSIKVPLITGATVKSHQGYSNALVVINKRGKIVKPIYYKTKLLAFGETLPGSQTLPFIKKLAPYFKINLVAGKGPQVQNLYGVNLGFQICYESLFDSFTRKLALNHAQVLVNITNDSWYGSWQQPWQHLIISLARAIEVRRPFIRVANTGFSAVIHSDGRIQEKSPINKPWAKVYDIPYYSKAPRTLFMSWGFYINEIFLLFMFLFSFAINKYLRQKS